MRMFHIVPLCLALTAPLGAQSAPAAPAGVQPVLTPLRAPMVNTHGLKVLFQKEHNRLAQAFDKKDIDGYMAHYTPDLKLKEFDGKQRDYAGVKDFTKDLMGCIKKVNGHVHKVLWVKATGDVAQAKVTEAWSFDIIDRLSMFGAKDEPHKITGQDSYDETWVKVGTEWKVSASTSTFQKVLVDGKPAK